MDITLTKCSNGWILTTEDDGMIVFEIRTSPEVDYERLNTVLRDLLLGNNSSMH